MDESGGCQVVEPGALTQIQDPFSRQDSFAFLAQGEATESDTQNASR